MAKSTGCGCGCGGQKKGNGNGSFRVTNIKEAQGAAANESGQQSEGFTIAGFSWWAVLLFIAGVYMLIEQQNG